MNRQTKQRIRKMIMQEITKMVGEDAIIGHDGKDNYRDTGYNPNARSPHNLTLTKTSDSYDDFGGADTMCEECGGKMYEGDCMECGYSNAGTSMLEEGGCGCSDSAPSKGSDYSLSSMISPTHDIESTLMKIEVPDHSESEKHKHNNYMAKPSLFKVAKYAQKLLNMIPDGYELDDWQRTKIAQISDDISEVYHSLDYDFHDDEI